MDYPTTSCSVRLTNVADFGPMISSTKLPQRLLTKEVWPQGAEADREHAQPPDQDWDSNMDQNLNTWAPGREGKRELWTSGRDQAVNPGLHQAWGSAGDSSHRKTEQTWIRGQSRGASEGWVAGRSHVHSQTWNLGRDPEAARQGEDQREDRSPIWRPGRDFNW